MGRGRSLNADDVLTNREQAKNVRSGRLREDDWNCRTVVVWGSYLEIDRRQRHVDLVSVSGGTVMMVVAAGVAVVDVQQSRLGIEVEESQAQNDRDRPHPNQSTLDQKLLIDRRGIFATAARNPPLVP